MQSYQKTICKKYKTVNMLLYVNLHMQFTTYIYKVSHYEPTCTISQKVGVNRANSTKTFPRYSHFWLFQKQLLTSVSKIEYLIYYYVLVTLETFNPTLFIMIYAYLLYILCWRMVTKNFKNCIQEMHKFFFDENPLI